MSIKVVITDDHPLAIGGIENMLQACDHIRVTGSFTSGAELLRYLEKEAPDVILLDILMPDLSGQELAALIRQQYPSIRILALTSLDAPYYVKSMMRRGCSGYLLKNTDRQTLIHAIEAVHNGEEFIEPALKELMLQNVMKGRRSHLTPLVPTLTQREKEVLQLIVEECTSQEIADRLFISLRTVEGHRLNLLQKLDAKNTVGLVKAALQMGLIE
jgi:DNA-binding NarL/FixJ family response regulator